MLLLLAFFLMHFNILIVNADVLVVIRYIDISRPHLILASSSLGRISPYVKAVSCLPSLSESHIFVASSSRSGAFSLNPSPTDANGDADAGDSLLPSLLARFFPSFFCFFSHGATVAK